ncbi:MAG: hypothetical protein AAF675_00550 [Pseudomonadota bacterium]
MSAGESRSDEPGRSGGPDRSGRSEAPESAGDARLDALIRAASASPADEAATARAVLARIEAEDARRRAGPMARLLDGLSVLGRGFLRPQALAAGFACLLLLSGVAGHGLALRLADGLDSDALALAFGDGGVTEGAFGDGLGRPSLDALMDQRG